MGSGAWLGSVASGTGRLVPRAEAELNEDQREILELLTTEYERRLSGFRYRMLARLTVEVRWGAAPSKERVDRG